MKLLAVALLLLSFASVALADGGGQKPPVNGTPTNPPSVAAIQLADGGGRKPPASGIASASLGMGLPA